MERRKYLLPDLWSAFLPNQLGLFHLAWFDNCHGSCSDGSISGHQLPGVRPHRELALTGLPRPGSGKSGPGPERMPDDGPDADLNEGGGPGDENA